MNEPEETENERLRDGIRRLVGRVQAERYTPHDMLTLYVAAEAAHILAGHLNGYGPDCADCIQAGGITVSEIRAAKRPSTVEDAIRNLDAALIAQRLAALDVRDAQEALADAHRREEARP